MEPGSPHAEIAQSRGTFIRLVQRIVIPLCFATNCIANELAPEGLLNFVDDHCLVCHDAVEEKGGLNLEQLDFALGTHSTFDTWVRIHDKVVRGEMPPKARRRPPPDEVSEFTKRLSQLLATEDRNQIAREGRAVRRRMNRFEYENSLRELLQLPALEIRDTLPEDPTAAGFNKVGSALDMSHVQMSRYLQAADFALREAIASQVSAPEQSVARFYAWDQPAFARRVGRSIRRTFPLVELQLQRDLLEKRDHSLDRSIPPEFRSSADPVRRDQESVAILMSSYQPLVIQFNRFRAPITGRYKLRFSAYSIWMSPEYDKVTSGRRDEPVTIYAETPPRILRKLGSFDVSANPTECELDVWLRAGETIRPDAARLVRSRPPDFKNPLAEADGMPGVAFKWMEVEGPIEDSWPRHSHRLLFGDLPITMDRANSQHRLSGPKKHVDVISKSPTQDAEVLLHAFMTKAYRRDVSADEMAPFMAVISKALQENISFTDAMIAGYTGVLCSPQYLYFDEEPGPLGHLAVANRLSYFLWNSPPDEELLELVAAGRLREAGILRQQTDRMLDDQRSRRFVDAFLDYWLDLRHIDSSTPDAELYPEYQLDDLLKESLVEETRQYFSTLLSRDLGVRHLVDSEFAMLNERLALHYDIPGVTGVALRPVRLDAGSVRGGILTHGSVLKVTANGTTTSPVMRGAWIMSRILGRPPPPPPASVPAVESDIRGATTIREQLALHRSEESCNSCHRNIDPPGLALENFDVMGAWRTYYRSVGSGTPVAGVGHNGLKFAFRTGPAVDPSGEMSDGRPFSDIRDFKGLLLTDVDQVARNLTKQLVLYATGAPVRFSDRDAIEQILNRTRPGGHQIRALIHEIIQSDLVLNK